MKILYTRHGQTDWNAEKRIQGKTDIELNETGIKQAGVTRDLLKDEEIDLIICSPLKRAMKTADIINENRNIPMIINENLSERDFGEFESIITDDFDWDGFWSYKKNKKYEKAESMTEFFDRIYSEIENIIKKYNDKKVLIVAHGGVSIPVYCYFNGIPDKETLVDMIMPNCDVFKFEI